MLLYSKRFYSDNLQEISLCYFVDSNMTTVNRNFFNLPISIPHLPGIPNHIITHEQNKNKRNVRRWFGWIRLNLP